MLFLKGIDGIGINVGGGSGGSILIIIMNMIGYGEIFVLGGLGIGLGSGGFGGWVGIYCWWRYKYGGKFIDYGG